MYEMNHILNCGYEIKGSYDPGSYERNFSTCVEKKPEKFRTSTEFKPVTSVQRSNQLSYEVTDVGSCLIYGFLCSRDE